MRWFCSADAGDGPVIAADHACGDRAVDAEIHHAEATSRNAEAVRVLGMLPHLSSRWTSLNGAFVDTQLSLSDVASGFGAMSKAFRMFLQSAILALSAFLFIKGK